MTEQRDERKHPAMMAIADYWRARWAGDRKLSTRTPGCLCCIGCRVVQWHVGCHMATSRAPYLDHQEAWRRGGIVVAVVSHPYDFDLDEAREWAAKNAPHLRVWSDFESWYYPGSTHRVVWERAAPA